MLGLNKTADLYAHTTSTSAIGEVVNSYPADGSPTTASVPVRFSGLKPDEQVALRELGGGQAVSGMYRVFSAADAGFSIRDRLKYNGEYYEIAAVSDVDEMAHHLESIAVHVEGVTS